METSHRGCETMECLHDYLSQSDHYVQHIRHFENPGAHEVDGVLDIVDELAAMQINIVPQDIPPNFGADEDDDEVDLPEM